MRRNHRVITCASYGGTGSSIITDYLSEFDNCYSLGEFEFRFLQDYNGVSDLEVKIIDNAHRLNSDIAIRDFKKNIDFYSGNIIFKRYSKYFGNNFKKISYQFIDSIIDMSWQGYWEYHQIEVSSIEGIFKYKLLPRIKNIFNKNGIASNIKKTKYYLSIPNREEFYKKTREYTRKLCKVIDCDEKYENLIFDQLVPATNINRYLNYFNDIKVIVVDRDPRDLYILNKEFWKESWIPENVDDYIKWFKLIRKNDEKEDGKRILRIKFEDFVYNYSEIEKKVLIFLDIEKQNHKSPKAKFNPEISKKNTKLWGKYKKYDKESKIIFNNLSEYCYTK